MFQYMIGNTDFSAVYLHNERLFYVDGMIVPVPYDFDMSGLVDASYAVVSQVRNEVLPIDKVTKRLYRGFEADVQTLEVVRILFLEKENEVFNAIENMETRMWGLQFHPEVTHTPQGKTLLKNFLYKVCHCTGTWKLANFASEAIEKVRQQVGDARVICGLSGGVDSSGGQREQQEQGGRTAR